MRREPARVPVKDQDVEKAIDEVRRSTVDLCRDPYLNGRDLEVELPSGQLVAVKHGLGRRFTNYSLSAPIGASSSGRIVESPPDADRLTIYLTATGYGADITVRMRVW